DGLPLEARFLFYLFPERGRLSPIPFRLAPQPGASLGGGLRVGRGSISVRNSFPSRSHASTRRANSSTVGGMGIAPWAPFNEANRHGWWGGRGVVRASRRTLDSRESRVESRVAGRKRLLVGEFGHRPDPRFTVSPISDTRVYGSDRTPCRAPNLRRGDVVA